MDIIFHEKQQGSLCAQHCLNALLQGSYFTAVDLADIGRRMDDEERMRMAEAGVNSDEYNRFLQEPSSNMDDSGYFSVQVLSSALAVWGLELLPFNSSDPRAAAARERPTDERAFICHYRDHWFAIRRLGRQWFNLNSLLKHPEFLSETYLSLFLAQLQNEGYSIFIVLGDLPTCEADEILTIAPLSPSQLPKPASATQQTTEADEDDELKAAIEMSRQEMEREDEQEAIKRAIQMSLSSSHSKTSAVVPGDSDELEKAIALSLQQDDSVQTTTNSAIETDPAFIRQKRLEMFQRQNK